MQRWLMVVVMVLVVVIMVVVVGDDGVFGTGNSGDCDECCWCGSW